MAPSFGERSLDYVPARVEREHSLPGGEGLDELAAAVFGGMGQAGRARLAPLLERHEEEVGKIAADDQDFELLSVARMDWALCDVSALGVAPSGGIESPEGGDSWAWRAVCGEIPGHADLAERPSLRAAASSVTGLFEVFPGEPTWVRDRMTGLILRVRESVGPWPHHAAEDGPAALWELRLCPDAAGDFTLARPPIDYPLELLEVLDEHFTRRFERPAWPTMQDLRRARLRYVRAGERTPISRMLMWR